ncbi:hypothetical protein ACXYL9_10230 [Qipengyuania sp. CAU 1752]
MNNSKDDDATRHSKLNPDLHERDDLTHDTSPTAAPLSTTGAKEGRQGEGWSALWLIAAVVSIAVTLFLIL